ncbi:MAG: hypothetical protein DRI48_06375, partial [Chloroflexi bacterium]
MKPFFCSSLRPLRLCDKMWVITKSRGIAFLEKLCYTLCTPDFSSADYFDNGTLTSLFAEGLLTEAEQPC